MGQKSALSNSPSAFGLRQQRCRFGSPASATGNSPAGMDRMPEGPVQAEIVDGRVLARFRTSGRRCVGYLRVCGRLRESDWMTRHQPGGQGGAIRELIPGPIRGGIQEPMPGLTQGAIPGSFPGAGPGLIRGDMPGATPGATGRAILGATREAIPVAIPEVTAGVIRGVTPGATRGPMVGRSPRPGSLGIPRWFLTG